MKSEDINRGEIENILGSNIQVQNSMSIQVRGKRGKGKWRKINQQNPRQAKSIVVDQPFEKRD